MRAGAPGAPPAAPGCTPRPPSPRSARLRAPLLLTLAALLTFEALGGLTIFVARLAAGTVPGEGLHVLGGALLAGLYAVYQWQHWQRVRPLRGRLDYVLGVIASVAMALALGSGLALALPWWQTRVAARSAGRVPYPPQLSALHTIGSMVVLTFVLAHLGAVLMRDRRPRGPAG